MVALDYSKARIDAVLLEIRRLKDSDFPHKDSRFALGKIEEHFESIRRDLQCISTANDPDLVRTLCSESLKQIFDYHKLLGFLLRSTNVRNSFEIYGPILRLCQQILGSKTRLVLSSEWEYSPHVYPVFAALPGVVLLGLPAAESGNPLLTPLAGHELGHTAWQQNGVLSRVTKNLEQALNARAQDRASDYKSIFGGDVNDLFANQNLSQAHSWAARQAEETFCDFMGIRLFGESYFHAFSYLLVPGLTTLRSPLYPSTKLRISNAVAAGKRFRADVPGDFQGSFVEAKVPSDERFKFLLDLAEVALNAVVTKLLDEVDKVGNQLNIPRPSSDRSQEALQAFRLMVPAKNAESLVNILNAGWKAYHDDDMWKELPNVYAERTVILHELVLKSIEVLEIEQLLGAT